MRRGARSLRVGHGWVGAALCVGLTCVPAGQRAQVLEPIVRDPGPHLVYPSRVPSGGVLIIEGPLREVIVSPLDDETRAIPGSVEMRFDYRVWRADDPLPLGEYWVQLIAGAGYGDSVYAIEVFETIEGAPRVVSEPSLSLVSKSIDSACCDQWVDGRLQRGAHCFGTVYGDTVALDFGLTTPEPTYVIGQYLFQARATEPYATTERAVPWNLLPASIELDVEAERYCFTLDAIDLASGEILALSDGAVCVEHGDLPAFETRVVEPSPSSLSASQCHAPPPEYQPQWCELNAGVCDSLRDDIEETGCALRAFVCDGAPFPGTRSHFYFPNDAPDASVDEPDDEEEPPGVDESSAEPSGCSASSSRQTSSSAHVLFAALLMLVSRRARRRAAFAAQLALAACLALVLAACEERDDPRIDNAPGVMGRLTPGETGPVPLRSIPRNGALPLGVFARMPLVTVRDHQHELLEGAPRAVMGYWAWVPSAPLEGNRLDVTLVYFNGPQDVVRNELTYTIAVVEPYARRAPGLVSEPSASLHSTPLENACCRAWDGAELQPTLCTPKSYQDRVLLGPGLISADPDVALRQHVFALYRALPDERQLIGVGLWQQWPELIFEDQANEYCFEIEAMDFSTGRLYGYRGLTPRCADHGNLPDLERHDADLTDSALDRTQCEIPPPGYEERWCALNEAACKAAPDAAGCARSGYVCDGEPLPEPTGAAGFAGIGAAGMGSPLSLGPDEEQVIVTGSEPPDCSVASGNVRARSSVLGCLALLVLALVTRSRRHRACAPSST